MRAVIDTNVLLEGLTSKGHCGDVVDAWVGREFLPCVSTALALEYEEVLTRKLGPAKRNTCLAAMQALLKRCEFVPIYFSVRPASKDPDDDFVVDCAFNAGALVVTNNLKDFVGMEAAIGVRAVPPKTFLQLIKEQ